MTDTEDVPEEVKDLHNKMVYILGGEIGPNSGTLLRLIGLFSDNPLTAAERSNTKCIEDLMEILMIYRKIAYGQYKPLIDKLKLVHPRMRTVVINFAVQMSTAIGNHTRGENSSISKRKFTVVSGSSASSQPFMFPGQGQSLGDGIQSSMEVDGASGGQRCIDQAVTCDGSRQGASVQVIQATNELPRTDEEELDTENTVSEETDQAQKEKEEFYCSDQTTSYKRLGQSTIYKMLAACGDVPNYSGQDSEVSSSDDCDTSSTSSDEEPEKELYNYCNIAVLLRIFDLYFRDPTFNAWIDQLSLEGFRELRRMLDEGKTDEAIKMFLPQPWRKKNCFGSSFKRLMIFTNKDQILDHQSCTPDLTHKTYRRIHRMFLKKIKKLECSLQEAVNDVLNGIGQCPYHPKKIPPCLPIRLQEVYFRSSQLPHRIIYYAGVTYRLAGILYHRHNRNNEEGDHTGDHIVVRAYDPVDERWVYSYSGEVDDEWEEDSGDPVSDDKYIFKLSVALYIVEDPPKEQHMASTNNDISMTNNDISMTNNDISMTNNDISMTNNDISMTDLGENIECLKPPEQQF